MFISKAQKEIRSKNVPAKKKAFKSLNSFLLFRYSSFFAQTKGDTFALSLLPSKIHFLFTH
jgi:hypothetical protein